MSNRRVGLSRHQEPAPLHTTIGGKPRSTTKVPESIDAPPLSSDDEDGSSSGEANEESDHITSSTHDGKAGLPISGPIMKSPYSPGSQSETSDGERNSNLSIKPTYFKTSRNATEPNKSTSSTASRKSSRKFAQSIGVKRRRLDANLSDPIEDPGDMVDAGSFSSRLSSSQTDHLTNDLGFVKRRTPAHTYKAQSAEVGKTTASKSKLLVPDDIESPEKGKPFKVLAPDDLLSSPSNSLPAQLKPIDKDKDSADLPSSPISEKTREPAGQRKKTNKASLFLKNGRKYRRREVATSPDRPPSPKAEFVIPADLPEEGVGEANLKDGSSRASQPLEDDSDLEDFLGTGSLESVKQESELLPSCPWCGEPVEESLLKEFSRGKRLNVRMQTKFCQKHRKQTALKTWEARNYPQIEWLRLEKRFAKHRTFLLGIVNGKASHFRTRLAEDISVGKARSMKKEGNLNPGYYGPRGFNIMSDYLVNEFGDLLKQRAVDDRVIAGRGSAAFIQAVLVAELGVQLIREDMDLSIEEARDVMEESKVIGEMVHEDT